MQRSWSRLISIYKKDTHTHIDTTTKNPKRQQYKEQQQQQQLLEAWTYTTHIQMNTCVKGIQINFWFSSIWSISIEFVFYSALQWSDLLYRPKNTKPIPIKTLVIRIHLICVLFWNSLTIDSSLRIAVQLLSFVAWLYLSTSFFFVVCVYAFKIDLSFKRNQKGSKLIPTRMTLFQCYLVI